MTHKLKSKTYKCHTNLWKHDKLGFFAEKCLHISFLPNFHLCLSCSNIKLQSFADTKTINCLQNFPFLDTDAEIYEFGQFCSTSPVKQVRGTVEIFIYLLFIAILIIKCSDRWGNKTMHWWIPPSINHYLSSMPHDFWDLMPADTNVMDSSHTDDNWKLIIN